jgi:hypothetical protein
MIRGATALGGDTPLADWLDDQDAADLLKGYL